MSQAETLKSLCGKAAKTILLELEGKAEMRLLLGESENLAIEPAEQGFSVESSEFAAENGRILGRRHICFRRMRPGRLLRRITRQLHAGSPPELLLSDPFRSNAGISEMTRARAISEMSP